MDIIPNPTNAEEAEAHALLLIGLETMHHFNRGQVITDSDCADVVETLNITDISKSKR